MKLIIVTPYFYPKIGGLENYAYNFCILLKKKYKWTIVVITSNHTGKKDKKEKLHGLTIYRLTYWFKISNTPINPLWYFKIKKIIREEHPNVINVHTPVPFIADMAALASQKIPYVLTYHAFSLYKYNFSFLNFLIRTYKFFEYQLFRNADKIIVVSDQVKEAIANEFKSKTHVIYNSIPSYEIPKKLKNRSKRAISLVFIGSLDKSHEWKGLNEILLAVKILSLEILGEVHLSIIGDGNNKHKYQRAVKNYGLIENVTFFGKKEGKNKSDILARSTAAIIYPKSANDAFPTVALEYWAHKLPVIASNIQPINGLFKKVHSAYLVQPNSPIALAKGINYIAINTNLANKIAIAGYSELRKKYVLENEVRKFDELLNKYRL